MTLQKKQQTTKPESIPFIDLHAQRACIENEVNNAIQGVLTHGAYIMGPEVAELEKQLSSFCGAKHAITCSSGTDALSLILMALDVKPGDAVFVPSFTFVATAEVVALLGATAVFVDCDAHDYNICPTDLERAIDWAKQQNLTPKGIITVDLFGLPANYNAVETIANNHDLWVMDDAAQGFGGVYNDRPIGTLGIATATSFFPAKPLGCYGDGGAIFTNDDDLADTIRSLRVHGKGTDKYDNVRIGLNGRIDTLQAAILLPKLAIFEQELQARQSAAEYYTDALKEHFQTPIMPKNGSRCAWAQYTLVTPEGKNREQIMHYLKDAGIPTAIYYPKPLHQQSAYTAHGRSGQSLPVCEGLSQRVFSLPMHPYLDRKTQDYIIEQLIAALSF